MSIFTENKIPVWASLGKKKVVDIRRDTHEAKLGLTVSSCIRVDDTVHLEANVWIEDKEERRFALSMGEEAVRRFHKVLADAMKEVAGAKHKEFIELRTSDSITTSAAKIGEQAEVFAKKHNKSLAEVVEMLVNSVMGNPWVDEELERNLLMGFGSDLECKFIDDEDEFDDEES